MKIYIHIIFMFFISIEAHAAPIIIEYFPYDKLIERSFPGEYDSGTGWEVKKGPLEFPIYIEICSADMKDCIRAPDMFLKNLLSNNISILKNRNITKETRVYSYSVTLLEDNSAVVKTSVRIGDLWPGGDTEEIWRNGWHYEKTIKNVIY